MIYIYVRDWNIINYFSKYKKLTSWVYLLEMIM